MDRAAFLRQYLDAPLTDQERGLLRDVIHATATNTLPMWGSMNIHRAMEVAFLFEKLKDVSITSVQRDVSEPA
jgi:hypothetical protein